MKKNKFISLMLAILSSTSFLNTAQAAKNNPKPQPSALVEVAHKKKDKKKKNYLPHILATLGTTIAGAVVTVFGIVKYKESLIRKDEDHIEEIIEKLKNYLETKNGTEKINYNDIVDEINGFKSEIETLEKKYNLNSEKKEESEESEKSEKQDKLPREHKRIKDLISTFKDIFESLINKFFSNSQSDTKNDFNAKNIELINNLKAEIDEYKKAKKTKDVTGDNPETSSSNSIGEEENRPMTKFSEELVRSFDDFTKKLKNQTFEEEPRATKIKTLGISITQYNELYNSVKNSASIEELEALQKKILKLKKLKEEFENSTNTNDKEILKKFLNEDKTQKYQEEIKNQLKEVRSLIPTPLKSFSTDFGTLEMSYSTLSLLTIIYEYFGPGVTDNTKEQNTKSLFTHLEQFAKDISSNPTLYEEYTSQLKSFEEFVLRFNKKNETYTFNNLTIEELKLLRNYIKSVLGTAHAHIFAYENIKTFKKSTVVVSNTNISIFYKDKDLLCALDLLSAINSVVLQSNLSNSALNKATGPLTYVKVRYMNTKSTIIEFRKQDGRSALIKIEGNEATKTDNSIKNTIIEFLPYSVNNDSFKSFTIPYISLSPGSSTPNFYDATKDVNWNKAKGKEPPKYKDVRLLQSHPKSSIDDLDAFPKITIGCMRDVAGREFSNLRGDPIFRADDFEIICIIYSLLNTISILLANNYYWPDIKSANIISSVNSHSVRNVQLIDFGAMKELTKPEKPDKVQWGQYTPGNPSSIRELLQHFHNLTVTPDYIKLNTILELFQLIFLSLTSLSVGHISSQIQGFPVEKLKTLLTPNNLVLYNKITSSGSDDKDFWKSEAINIARAVEKQLEYDVITGVNSIPKNPDYSTMYEKLLPKIKDIPEEIMLPLQEAVKANRDVPIDFDSKKGKDYGGYIPLETTYNKIKNSLEKMAETRGLKPVYEEDRSIKMFELKAI